MNIEFSSGKVKIIFRAKWALMTRFVLFLFSLFFVLFISSLGFAEIKPPEQPAAGPGSTDYNHDEVTTSVFGEGDNQYWIFEPSKPKPVTAPLIIFIHGWGAVNPMIYGAWIEHVVNFRSCGNCDRSDAGGPMEKSGSRYFISRERRANRLLSV